MVCVPLCRFLRRGPVPFRNANSREWDANRCESGWQWLK